MRLLVILLTAAALVPLGGCTYSRTDKSTGETETISRREYESLRHDQEPSFRAAEPNIGADQAH